MRLHTHSMITVDVIVGVFSSLHARAFSHETEDIEKVELAIRNVLDVERVSMHRTEGVHGNAIFVLEASTDDPKCIDGFLRRLTKDDLRAIIGTAVDRVDEDCNMFIRLDKQDAFRGNARLALHDDVISLRMRIRSFPAKRERATSLAVEHLTRLAEERAA